MRVKTLCWLSIACRRWESLHIKLKAFHGHSRDVFVPFFAASLVKRHPNVMQNVENVTEHNGAARQLARPPAHFGIDLPAVSVTHAPITLT